MSSDALDGGCNLIGSWEFSELSAFCGAAFSRGGAGGGGGGGG